jgi:hypothetical protein
MNNKSRLQLKSQNFASTEILEGRQLLYGGDNDLALDYTSLDGISFHNTKLNFGIAVVTILSIGALCLFNGSEAPAANLEKNNEAHDAKSFSKLELELKSAQENLVRIQNEKNLISKQLNSLKNVPVKEVHCPVLDNTALKTELMGTKSAKLNLENELKALSEKLEKFKKTEGELLEIKSKNLQLEKTLKGLQSQINEFEEQGCEFYVVV